MTGHAIAPRLTRRSLVAAPAALMLAHALPAAAAQPDRIRFAVFRNGRRIGVHQVSFEGPPEARRAISEVEMTVRLGFVPVFHYTHRAVETWRGDSFEALSSATTTNGRRETVEARRAGDGIEIRTPEGVWRAPAGAAPLTHWNSRVLQGVLFNPQTGRLLKVHTRRAATGEVPGGAPAAWRWLIRGEAEIDDWYEADGAWSALRGRLPDRSELEYHLT